jgi:hypothetical protein
MKMHSMFIVILTYLLAKKYKYSSILLFRF